MILHISRMRRNVNRNVYNAGKIEAQLRGLTVREDARVSCFSILRKHVASVSSHLYSGITRGSDFFSTLLELLTPIGLYICQLAKKITRTKSHVYLELSAKRASVRTYINMHARKKLTYFYICLLKIRHARAKKLN